MTIKETIIVLIIHLVVPLVGLLYFLQLRKQMKRENIQNPPTIALFVIFVAYGGLLLVLLTGLFWYWSGMASLGLFFLIFVMPILMGIITYRHRHTKFVSKYHWRTYELGLAYFLISICIYIAILVVKLVF